MGLEKVSARREATVAGGSKVVEDKIKQWFASRGSVPDIGDIRRNIVVPLYAGRRTRGKRKR